MTLFIYDRYLAENNKDLLLKGARYKILYRTFFCHKYAANVRIDYMSRSEAQKIKVKVLNRKDKNEKDIIKKGIMFGNGSIYSNEPYSMWYQENRNE